MHGEPDQTTDDRHNENRDLVGLSARSPRSDRRLRDPDWAAARLVRRFSNRLPDRALTNPRPRLSDRGWFRFRLFGWFSCHSRVLSFLVCEPLRRYRARVLRPCTQSGEIVVWLRIARTERRFGIASHAAVEAGRSADPDRDFLASPQLSLLLKSAVHIVIASMDHWPCPWPVLSSARSRWLSTIASATLLSL